MAGAATRSPLSPPIKRLTGASNSTSVAILRPKISAGAPISNSNRKRLLTCSGAQSPSPAESEGPSCLLVGPVETASQETLEALYRQAREAYYNGNPLIFDDMFDRVELKLRLYGSKYAVKYPRCSLRRQSAYADAQPDAFNSGILDSSQSTSMELLGVLNCALFMLLGYAIGSPIALASARALQGLWKNDLVAMKGACPSCGEEVFAFLRSENGNSSPYRANCHVCDCVLEFRTNAEKCIPQPGRRWVHGRVYLISDRRSQRRQLLT